MGQHLFKVGTLGIAAALTVLAISLGDDRQRPPLAFAADTNLFAGWNVANWEVAGCVEPHDASHNLIDEGVLNVAAKFLAQSQSWQLFDPDVADALNSLREACEDNIFWLNVSSVAVWQQPTTTSSPTATGTATPSSTATATATPSATATPTATSTPSPTATAIVTPTATPTPTVTVTPTPTYYPY